MSDRAMATALRAYRQPEAFADLPPRRRSVARRIKERLVLGVAALALFGASVWIIPYESSDTAGSSRVQGMAQPAVHGIEKSQERVASGEPTPAIASRRMMPGWLLGSLELPPSVFQPRRAQ